MRACMCQEGLKNAKRGGRYVQLLCGLSTSLCSAVVWPGGVLCGLCYVVWTVMLRDLRTGSLRVFVGLHVYFSP